MTRQRRASSVSRQRRASSVSRRRREAGFSLIELLVSMVIGLVLVLAITSVMVRGEGIKRTMTTLNDVNQTGAYLSYVLDRSLRSAGSGYAQRWKESFGCLLNASLDNTAILPRSGGWPAPFSKVPAQARLAPLVIGKGMSDAGSDVLMVMTGNAGYSEAPPRVLPASVSANALRLPNTLGSSGDDLVLLAEDGVGCMLQQVTSGFVGSTDQQLPLSGRYYSATGTNVNLASFGQTSNSVAITLGNAVKSAPLFQFIGVGDNATLFSYDLFQVAGASAPVPISDGVVEMHALYGVDTGTPMDGHLDTWVDPGASPYTATELLSGTAAAQANLRRIVAVRVALVLRSPLVERNNATGEPVTAASLTLFRDLPGALQQTLALGAADRTHRYRVVEFTVPLRNMLLL